MSFRTATTYSPEAYFCVLTGWATILLPFYGYIVEYFYEVGYLNSFDIPSMLVQVNIESLVPSSIIIIFIMFMFLHYYDGILVPFFAKTKPYSVVRRIIKAVFMYIFPLTIMVYVYPPIIFSNITYLLTGLLLTYLFFDIGYPLLKYRREAISMDDKLKKSYEVEQQSFLGFHSNCLYSNQTIINLSHLAVLAIIMAATAWVSGIKLGQREAWFLTFMKDRSEYALIRNYRSEKIGAKIIKCGITNSYILLDSVTELKLTLKYIPTRTSSCKSLK